MGGTYVVSLTVLDAKGLSSTATVNATISSSFTIQDGGCPTPMLSYNATTGILSASAYYTSDDPNQYPQLDPQLQHQTDDPTDYGIQTGDDTEVGWNLPGGIVNPATGGWTLTVNYYLYDVTENTLNYQCSGSVPTNVGSAPASTASISGPTDLYYWKGAGGNTTYPSSGPITVTNPPSTCSWTTSSTNTGQVSVTPSNSCSPTIQATAASTVQNDAVATLSDGAGNVLGALLVTVHTPYKQVIRNTFDTGVYPLQGTEFIYGAYISTVHFRVFDSVGFEMLTGYFRSETFPLDVAGDTNCHDGTRNCDQEPVTWPFPKQQGWMVTMPDQNSDEIGWATGSCLLPACVPPPVLPGAQTPYSWQAGVYSHLQHQWACANPVDPGDLTGCVGVGDYEQHFYQGCGRDEPGPAQGCTQ
jgi:hypothetical protein